VLGSLLLLRRSSQGILNGSADLSSRPETKHHFDLKEQSFDCHMDWYRLEDIATARSRTGFVTLMQTANCLIIWTSRLQIQVALSSTESEDIALSTALRDIACHGNEGSWLRLSSDELQGALPHFRGQQWSDPDRNCAQNTKHINTAFHPALPRVNTGKPGLSRFTTCKSLHNNPFANPCTSLHHKYSHGISYSHNWHTPICTIPSLRFPPVNL
jgi:hypothetical protein